MTKVFLLCSGLGHVSRGYESFFQECFEALSEGPGLEVALYKGGGSSSREQTVLWNLPRRSPVGAWLGKVARKNAYWTEQVTFTLSLLPHLMRQRPDVVFFSDATVGNLLWHWRRLTRQSYSLLLSNGGPVNPPFPQWDHVQQLAPMHVEAALAAGQPADRQSLVPYGIGMNGQPPRLSQEERAHLRRGLNIPINRPVILAVGAVNRSHKRMDYLVREVAALPAPRPYLVILGQQDEETPEVSTLAEHLLGEDNYYLGTVAHSETSRYYQAADMFTLTSLKEGFGRVFLEASSWGLPCLVHDYALTRYIFGDFGLYADFQQTGSLSGLISRVMAGCDLPTPERQQQMVFDRFSWQHLRPDYVEMLNKCAESSSRNACAGACDEPA